MRKQTLTFFNWDTFLVLGVCGLSNGFRSRNMYCCSTSLESVFILSILFFVNIVVDRIFPKNFLLLNFRWYFLISPLYNCSFFTFLVISSQERSNNRCVVLEPHYWWNQIWCDDNKNDLMIWEISELWIHLYCFFYFLNCRLLLTAALFCSQFEENWLQVVFLHLSLGEMKYSNTQ